MSFRPSKIRLVFENSWEIEASIKGILMVHLETRQNYFDSNRGGWTGIVLSTGVLCRSTVYHTEPGVTVATGE